MEGAFAGKRLAHAWVQIAELWYKLIKVERFASDYSGSLFSLLT